MRKQKKVVHVLLASKYWLFAPTKREHMHIRTLLNTVYPHKGFVYGQESFTQGGTRIQVDIRARKNSKPVCSQCGRAGPVYDTQAERRFDMIPVWSLPVDFVYAMRRVSCPECGVRVEAVPWGAGKSPLTSAFAHHLASWARLLSWKEVGQRCGASWDTVARAVSWLVAWGLEHRSLDAIKAIGVDEIQFKKGQKYLTLVYQIDAGQRRLLWMGKERTMKCFHGFFDMLGPERCAALAFVCSDMWRPYLKVIAKRVPDALNILDRFHIASYLTKAVDDTRRDEVRGLNASGKPAHLHKSRWVWLKRRSNLTGKQRTHLRELMAINLRTVKAYLFKEQFEHLWTYTSATWAGKFIDTWCRDVMRHRSLPRLKKVAKTLQTHRALILNYFKAKTLTKNTFSSGVVEGFNNKAKLCIRKSYGFRSDKYREMALYHALGNLPEPILTHRFA